LKCFIENQTVYYAQDGTLYHTFIASDCFDTENGTPVRESTEDLNRIQRLVTEEQVAQDWVQLELF
jgi:hypothetical protein